MDGADHRPVRASNRCRERRDALGELVADPCVPVGADGHETPAQRGRVNDRGRREGLERSREEPVERVRGERGEHDLTGGDGVHRDARSGPVADLDLMRRSDLIDVVDDAAVRHGDAGNLADRRSQLGQVWPRDGNQVASRHVARREVGDPGTEPVAGPAGLLLDGAFVPECGQQARSRALWEPDPLCHLGHADRTVGQR